MRCSNLAGETPRLFLDDIEIKRGVVQKEFKSLQLAEFAAIAFDKIVMNGCRCAVLFIDDGVHVANMNKHSSAAFVNRHANRLIGVYTPQCTVSMLLVDIQSFVKNT